MKKLVFTLTLFLAAFLSKAQEVSVEKSVSSLQVGVLGVFIHHEGRLSNTIALRGELGYVSTTVDGGPSDKSTFVMVPLVTVEPRVYYNLKQRAEQGKVITGNSGNFFSLKISYNPDWLIIPDYDDVVVANQTSIIPTWGLRRTAGNHFDFEAGFGVGYRYVHPQAGVVIDSGSKAAVNLHVRIGYRF